MLYPLSYGGAEIILAKRSGRQAADSEQGRVRRSRPCSTVNDAALPAGGGITEGVRHEPRRRFERSAIRTFTVINADVPEEIRLLALPLD